MRPEVEGREPRMSQTPLGESLRKIEAELATGRPEQALALCQELQARYPRALALQRALGEIYLALRKPREALGALERALSGDPEDARALCDRAIIHQMHGDSMAALAWYRRACDLRPDDQVLRATYRELAAALGQPPYRPTRLGLAQLYLRGDLFAHAVREWEALITEQPDALEVQVGLAETLWRSRNIPTAEVLCQRIVTNSPACVKALLLLGVILLDRGAYEEARRHALRAAELDPDQRIAQALFSDRIAAGDRALIALLAGEQIPTGRERQPAASRPVSSRGTSTSLQPKDQTAFSETEYMLWGPDDETRERGRVVSRPAPARQMPPSQPTPATAAAPTASGAGFVPPALAGQDAAMDETEARAAMNWINWLQGQGARMHPDVLSATPTLERAGPTNPATAQRASVPSRPAVPSRSTGPLPPPTTEALRAMFAELDPDASATGRTQAQRGTRAVDDEVTARAPAVGRTGKAAPRRGADSPAWDNERGGPAGWLAQDGDPEPSLYGRPERRETETQRLAQAHALLRSGQGGPPPDAVTLEALERRFAASGFQRVEPQPGLLAAMSAGDSGVARPAGEIPIAPSESAVLSSVAPNDYPGRLRFARARRAEGRLDEALAEYRVLLKQAPALLPEVQNDLQECVREAPQHPEVHRLLGDARIQQGDYLGALEAYNRAVALTQPDGM
jgi:tetratricopeptide (TPR) repeat protein